jgi:hypothetical protein
MIADQEPVEIEVKQYYPLILVLIADFLEAI